MRAAEQGEGSREKEQARRLRLPIARGRTASFPISPIFLFKASECSLAAGSAGPNATLKQSAE